MVIEPHLLSLCKQCKQRTKQIHKGREYVGKNKFELFTKEIGFSEDVIDVMLEFHDRYVIEPLHLLMWGSNVYEQKGGAKVVAGFNYMSNTNDDFLDVESIRRILCNAGIYVLSPSVLRFVPDGQNCDMTSLIERIIAGGKNVSVFPLHEFWTDIGNPHDLEEAQRLFRKRENE